ncbi:hypothetical protein AB0M87_17070 [Streptomyces sp. NPDC051320]|uniref:hypothetical protein n=1 Tax=Streptomyces sp. NPDC051320 TaxID=3154644 RepID=UPI003417AA11
MLPGAVPAARSAFGGLAVCLSRQFALQEGVGVRVVRARLVGEQPSDAAPLLQLRPGAGGPVRLLVVRRVLREPGLGLLERTLTWWWVSPRARVRTSARPAFSSSRNRSDSSAVLSGTSGR